MKETHVVEFIGKPEEIISRMSGMFKDVAEIRVTIRYDVTQPSIPKNSALAKKMTEIHKVISVNKRLKKHDSAIIDTLVKRFKVSVDESREMVSNFKE